MREHLQVDGGCGQHDQSLNVEARCEYSQGDALWKDARDRLRIACKAVGIVPLREDIKLAHCRIDGSLHAHNRPERASGVERGWWAGRRRAGRWRG